MYLPGDSIESDDDLVFEPTAYKMYHVVSAYVSMQMLDVYTCTHTCNIASCASPNPLISHSSFSLPLPNLALQLTPCFCAKLSSSSTSFHLLPSLPPSPTLLSSHRPFLPPPPSYLLPSLLSGPSRSSLSEL